MYANNGTNKLVYNIVIEIKYTFNNNFSPFLL